MHESRHEVERCQLGSSWGSPIDATSPGHPFLDRHRELPEGR